MNAKLEVINAMTESANWLEQVQEEMGHGKDILLLLSPFAQSRTAALAKLCHAYHYSQATDLPGDYWKECERLLNLNDFASKEHGISLDLVFLLQPQAGPMRQLPF